MDDQGELRPLSTEVQHNGVPDYDDPSKMRGVLVTPLCWRKHVFALFFL